MKPKSTFNAEEKMLMIREAEEHGITSYDFE